MRYYVLAPSGERYGPADVPTLNEWTAQNRLFPTSKLMEEMSGNVVAASAVPGLSFGQAAPPAPAPGPAPMQPLAPGTPYQPLPPGPANYPRPGYAPQGRVSTDDGLKDLLAAFGMAIAAPLVGLLLMYGIFIAIGGIQFAWRAHQKGQKLAILALVLNIVAVPLAFYMRFVLRYQLTGGRLY